MEINSNQNTADNPEVLPVQQETSMSSASDVDLKYSSEAVEQLKASNPVSAFEETTDSSSRLEIVELARSPLTGRSKSRDCVPELTHANVPRNVEDLNVNNNNHSGEDDVDAAMDYSYQSADTIDSDSDRSGCIRELRASPVVLRPKLNSQRSEECSKDKLPIEHTDDDDNIRAPVPSQLYVTPPTPTTDDCQKRTSPHDDVPSVGNGDDKPDGNPGNIRKLECSPVVLRAKKKKKNKPAKAKVEPIPAGSNSADVNAKNNELAMRINNKSVPSKAAPLSADDPAAAGRRTSAIRTGNHRKDEHRLSHTDTGDDFKLTATERRWIVSSASSDRHTMSRLLADNNKLAARRDPITGLTALHWAAKNGRLDVVQLLLESPRPPPIDCRTREAGHTPLHLAAMHGRHDVIEHLIIVYKADCDAVDFAGQLPVKHLIESKCKSATSKIDVAFSAMWMRSEVLLKPSRKCFVAANETTDLEWPEPAAAASSANWRQSIWSSLTGSNNPSDDNGGISRRESMPTIKRGIAALSQSIQYDIVVPLPPRPLPSVSARQAVTSLKNIPTTEQSSTEDNEDRPTGENRRPKSSQCSGSKADIESLV